MGMAGTKAGWNGSLSAAAALASYFSLFPASTGVNITNVNQLLKSKCSTRC